MNIRAFRLNPFFNVPIKEFKTPLNLVVQYNGPIFFGLGVNRHKAYMFTKL